MYVKIHWLFLSVHEIDHPSNISTKRMVEQLTENSGERKELLEGLKSEAPKYRS